MKEDEWNQLCQDTVDAMAEYVSPFLSPISKVINTDYGELAGTGTYLEIDNSTVILTNQHVAAHSVSHQLTHQFHGNNQIHSINGGFESQNHPFDIAVAHIDIMASTHDALAVPFCLYAPQHDPVTGEILYLSGFAGDRSKFLYGTLITPITSYATQEDIEQSRNLSPYHFALPWLPDKVKSLTEHSPRLPLPPGLSGSLVWNTRRVECQIDGQIWSPDQARVTGLIWGWSECSNWLYATKVEHLRDSIPKLIASLGSTPL